MGNSVRFKASLDDKVSGPLGRIRDDFDRLGKAKGAMSVLQGVGIGAGISAWGLMSSAVSKTTEYLTDAVAMAKEEEVGINRLAASLEANVPGWDGNTEAIEKNIGAMVRSTGFSDGAMRDSLAKLVAATGNVDDAFRLQATAMDLARFKGIDLVEASTALIKVEGGQYRALKELGIVLKKGATATEALAAVQKVAGGQMAAYMDTAAGKTEVLNNRLGDMQEELGAKLTGPLTTATELILRFMDAVDSDAPVTFEDRLEGLGDMARSINPMLWANNWAMGEMGDASERSADQLAAAAAVGAEAWDTGSERIGASLGNISTASDDTKDDVLADNRKIKRSYSDLADYLLDQYTTNYDTAMGIIEARADLHNAKSDADRADAYADLAALGALDQQGYKDWIATLERLAKGTKGKVHDAYVAAINDIRALKAAASGNIKVTVMYKTGNPVKGYGQFADGGPVKANTPIVVGEEGPELFVPKTSGTIIPNDEMTSPLVALPGGKASPRGGESVVVHTHINLDGREIARVVDRHLYYEAARAPRSA